MSDYDPRPSHHQDKIIAVTGATGKQGGVTARHLLAKGWQVRALTRDPNKPAAQALASAGAEIVPGDMDRPEELVAAFQGAYGVFSVQNFWLPNVGSQGEVRQGKHVADAARAARVQHFVYTSVASSDRNTGIPHFESKWQIEQYIHSLELPVTILRPVAFMDNFLWSRERILAGEFPGRGLSPEKTLQLIAAEDIGAIVALAFERPQEFIGRTIEIAGDELTEPQIAEMFSQAIGRPVAVIAPSFPQGAQPDSESLRMFAFFANKGYEADIPALRRIYPDLMTFETWVRRTGWKANSLNPQTNY